MKQTQVTKLAGSEVFMRVKGMGIIKRGIAVGLIALMACVNPLQTLSPANGTSTGSTDVVTGLPTEASAAEKSDPYVGEVRLAVDKDASKAKQILEDAGYEVIDQDLNEKAGSFWNKLGDQAVYMGIKRTDDASKAIRDMKTMNMLGQYSYTDLEQMLNQNRDEAYDLYKKLENAVRTYRDGYKAGDLLSVKSHDLLNYIVEDDSGSKVGDLLLSDASYGTMMKMLMEGNRYLVGDIVWGLILSGEEKSKNGDVWTERMSKKTSYNDVLKDYAREKYGKADMNEQEKEEIKRMVDSDLDESAKKVLSRWDEIRSMFLNEDDMVYRLENAAEDGMNEEETVKLQEDIRSVSIIEYLKSVKYGKKTLYSFFSLPKESFEKDITKLYPFVYALSGAHRDLLFTMDYPMLFESALIRIGLRDKKKNVEERINEYMKAQSKNLEEVSLYAGVDRAMYGPNAAMTSKATSNRSANPDDFKNQEEANRNFNIALCITSVVFGLALISVAVTMYFYFSDLVYGPTWLDIVRYNYSTIDFLYKWHMESYLAAVMLPVITLIIGSIATYLYIIKQKVSHNFTQISIPEIMVDYETENDAGKYVTYHVVHWNRMREDKKERGDRADLNGDAAREWLALYTTKDKAVGDPIFADSIVAKTGNEGGEKIPEKGYVPLTMFGLESIQNLVSEKYSFNDEVGGIWMWYKKGTVADSSSDELIDDREDETTEEAEAAADGDENDQQDTEAADADAASGEAAETTGSNIAGGSIVIFITLGAVGGFIIGMICMYFIRRKKQVIK